MIARALALASAAAGVACGGGLASPAIDAGDASAEVSLDAAAEAESGVVAEAGVSVDGPAEAASDAGVDAADAACLPSSYPEVISCCGSVVCHGQCDQGACSCFGIDGGCWTGTVCCTRSSHGCSASC